jgi:hypothetical protein
MQAFWGLLAFRHETRHNGDGDEGIERLYFIRNIFYFKDLCCGQFFRSVGR